MTLTTARHSDMGAGGSQSRYLTYMTSDPQMIEVAAFPALVLRLRDEVTSPLGALWLQGLGRRWATLEGTQAPLFVGSVVVICLMDSGPKTCWPMTGEQLTLSGLNCCCTERFSQG